MNRRFSNLSIHLIVDRYILINELSMMAFSLTIDRHRTDRRQISFVRRSIFCLRDKCECAKEFIFDGKERIEKTNIRSEKKRLVLFT